MTARAGARARPRRANRAGADPQVVGALLILGGCAWLLRQTGLVEIQLQTALSVLLLALGVGMVVTARRAGGAPLVALGLVLTGALAVTSSVDLGVLQQGVGGHTHRPSAAGDISAAYETGFGDLHVDLREVADLNVEQSSRMNVGIGSIEVVVPEGMLVDVRAKVGAGKLVLLEDPPRNGNDLVASYNDPDVEGSGAGAGRLVLDLKVGFGSVSVTRAGR